MTACSTVPQMKTLRTLKWSGNTLSFRTRPCIFCEIALFRQLRLQPTTRHLSAARLLRQQAQAVSIPGEESSPQKNPPQYGYKTLCKFPSPPPDIPPSAKLSALHARLLLSQRLPLQTLARCLVDASADPDKRFNNSSLMVLGTDLLDYFTTEEMICRYPRLPTAVLDAVRKAYVGERTLATVAREWGVELCGEPGGEVDPGYLQARIEEPESLDSIAIRHFNPLRSTSSDPSNPPYSETNLPNNIPKPISVDLALARFASSLVAAIHLHVGRKPSRLFFLNHFLSRHLDVHRMFDFKQPTRDLANLCRREDLEPPVARILSETGRKSRHPVFNVGVFSGREKLGEAEGSSLNEARTRAAVRALKGWYLYSPVEVKTMSEVEDKGEEWKGVMVDGGEIVN